MIEEKQEAIHEDRNFEKKKKKVRSATSKRLVMTGIHHREPQYKPTHTHTHTTLHITASFL